MYIKLDNADVVIHEKIKQAVCHINVVDYILMEKKNQTNIYGFQ